ncbi:glycosyltransferase family 4 protein [Gammaproteobacteria bacterium]|jgi:glycosyltransferase involved in cell wall biosynthesis|nr:glycosyltransferase family 4 protein [Gammaproteobacteria bacterium]
MIKVLGLTLWGNKAASHRMRLRQYKQGLLDSNIDLEVHHLLDNQYLERRFDGKGISMLNVLPRVISRLKVVLSKDNYDVTILHCELIPFIPGWVEKLLLPKPYIFDFDDAWHLRYKLNRSYLFKLFFKNKVDKVVEGATLVMAGNSYLHDYASSLNSKTNIFPTVLDTDRYQPKPNNNSDKFIIGWIGSPSTAPYLKKLIPSLTQLGLEGSVLLRVIGGKAPNIPNIEVEEMPWSEGTEVYHINSFDIGVMPLVDDEWSKGKCAFKLLQYMACELPVVASNVGANIDVVSSDCGYLVDSDQAWLDAMRSLRDNLEQRSSFGKNGRKKVIQSYSLKSNLPILIKAIKGISKKA